MVNIAVELATAYVSIVPSMKGVERTLKTELGDQAEVAGDDAGKRAGAGFAAQFGKLAAVAGAALIGSKVVSFLGDSVEAATNLGESVNAVNKIFGDSSGEILDWGKNNATQFGLSQAAFNSLATPLGALLKNSGLEDISGQTVDLTKRAADLASVFNVDVSEAMEAINSGLKGEADPLEKFGIGLSAAKVESQALADTGKKLAKELTDQEKAQARINLIMKESASVAGDFTATSGEYANAARISAAKTEELQAKLGVKLVPVMQKVNEIKLALVTILVDRLIPAFEAVSWFVNDTLIPAFQSIFGFLADHQEILIGVAVAIAVPLVGAFIAWAVSAGAAAVATIAAMLPVIALGVAIAALVAGVIWAYQNWDFFREAVDKVADAGMWLWRNVLQPFGEWIVNSLVPWIRDDLVPVILSIVDAIAGIATKIAGMAQTLAGWVVDVWTFGGQVLDFFRELPGKVGAFFADLGDKIIAPFRKAFDWIKEQYDRSIGPVIDKLGSIGGAIGGIAGKLPGFDSGGVVGGPRGSAQLVLAHGGETILPTHRMDVGAALGAVGGAGPLIGTAYFGDRNQTTDLDFWWRSMQAVA